MKIGPVQDIELQMGTGSSLFKSGCNKILSNLHVFFGLSFFFVNPVRSLTVL